MGTLGVKFVSCKASPKRNLACFLDILGYEGFQDGSWEGKVLMTLGIRSGLGTDADWTILMLGLSGSLGESPGSRLRIDHWAFRPVDRGTLRDERNGLPTVMGVGALERFGSCNPSPYTLSRNAEAERICPSEASAAARDAIKDGWVEG